MKRIFVVAFILLFMLSSYSLADSLWTKTSSSAYCSDKSFQVGDIITVLVLESAQALHKSGTKTDVKDDFAFSLNNSIARLNPLLGSNSALNAAGSNKYAGSGSTERASNLTAKVAAVVTEVMPNGNLAIEGKHKVVVNEDDQEIIITGVVRSKDVSTTNTIYSYQVADAKVTMKGTGVVQEAESPGFFTRIMNWLF